MSITKGRRERRLGGDTHKSRIEKRHRSALYFLNKNSITFLSDFYLFLYLFVHCVILNKLTDTH